MSNRIRFLVRSCSLLALLVLVGCAGRETKMAAEPAPSALDKAIVHDRILIAGQPTRDDLDVLQARGIDRVFNLRTAEEMAELDFSPADVLSTSGITYQHFPVGAGKDYTPELLAEFKAAVDGSDGKVLLHCAGGVRAAVLYAAYAMKYLGMEPDEAMRTLEAAGSWPLPLERLTGEKLKVVRAE